MKNLMNIVRWIMIFQTKVCREIGSRSVEGKKKKKRTVLLPLRTNIDNIDNGYIVYLCIQMLQNCFKKKAF